MRGKLRVLLALSISLLSLTIAFRGSALMKNESMTPYVPFIQTMRPAKSEYRLHRRVKTTFFFIGQRDRVRSGFLNNGSSAWTTHWVEAYGGVDSPTDRRGHFPRGFRPKENPFYCALPYNDVSPRGHKPKALEVIPWAKAMRKLSGDEFVSYCKNRWVKIVYKGRVCYAQWEDVGPFQTDDWRYVFGAERPRNKRNGNVGLDISPACFAYLGMRDNDYTDWQFVDFDEVPPGPWLRVITSSNPSW